MRRALVSVTDKTGIVEFCKGLEALDFEIVSTGGTLKKLQEEGVKAIAIDDVTGFPEILDGRVKTLHPMVHGGLLFRRDVESHVKTVEERYGGRFSYGKVFRDSGATGVGEEWLYQKRACGTGCPSQEDCCNGAWDSAS